MSCDDASNIGALSKRDFELLAEVRCRLRRFQSFSEHRARESGLTPQQHQAMLMIAGMPGRDWASVGEIADRLQIAHHSAVGLVDRLETEGMARREKQPLDHRRVEVHLTDRGRETLDGLSAEHRSELERLAPQLIDLLQELRSRAG